MELFLRSQDNNMWYVLEVGEYVPLAKDSTNHKPQAEWTTTEADRLLLNTKAKLFIKSVLCREEYDRIMECKTAKEIWETLQTHHEETNSVKETRIDIGVRKFELFEMKEEETIDQMYGRFTSITNELNSLGKAYTTHERIRKILRCLPKTWRPIVTAITVAKDLTKVSLEDLIGSLKAHESVLQEDKPKRKMIALETQSGECSQKDEALCEDEESLQEDDEEELAFLSRRIQRLMTRRNQLKKNFQPKRNGAKPEVDLSKIQCYGCNQFGHYKNDCPKNKQKKPFFKKKSMMATWDDLEEAQSEVEEQEANDGHLEAFCFKKKARKQDFYRTPEHSQNGLRNRNFRKPVHRHSLNTLRRDVYKRTPYKRSSYSQRIPYKKFETDTQGPKKLWVPKNLLNSNVGMPSSSQEKAFVLGQWMLKTYDRRQE
ncbi:hypothetical protein TSUD_419200 [Trifolium subterraneum]|uniref:CCHC-type domain-containing protein n=1 Tax=Trifolium subterraneum TaxID=3900 RepID=A0A1B5Z8L1_TRISU|nr:hypothetical protein TSUD_419200 [Trifolium subterraneum]